MQEDVIINQCVCARDLVYALAKMNKSFIRLKSQYCFEILQGNLWTLVNIDTIINIVLNFNFLDTLWSILHRKISEGNVRAKSLSDDLLCINNVSIKSLFLEAFIYHCSNDVQGPLLYFIGLDNGPFEPNVYVLSPSRTIGTVQQENICAKIVLGVQCMFPEILLNQLITYLEPKRLGYITCKFQITETDVNNLCLETRLWSYLRKIDFV